MKSTLALLASALLLLAGCEGLVTGSEALRTPLSQQADGGFAPVRLTLSPDMNPIALNLHGETIANMDEGGRWNAYSAVLTRNGNPVGTGQFNVHNTGSVDGGAHGGAFMLTMLFVEVPEAGEYELTVTTTKPKEITVEAAQLVVRKNTQPLPRPEWPQLPK